MPFLRDLTAAISVSSLLNGTGGIFRDGNITAPCDSPIFCYGQMLQEIQLARPFADSKTFVDMPTKVPLAEVQQGFAQLTKPLQNNTQLLDFLAEYFSPAGAELVPLDTANLTIEAAFLDTLNNSVNREFLEQVVNRWPNLTRTFNESSICTDCQSSFIPVQRPFVVAGGRFREPYYWDSYWILQGLLRTGGNFTQISRNQIENFLDDVEEFGFVPNGNRRYYLNRSQPPVLAQMVRIYAEYTGDLSILERAIPLLIREQEFFERNRTVAVTLGNQTYSLNRYNVDNNQPRPESYREDYEQVNNASYFAADGMVYPAEALTQNQKDFLYRNLASGAESGWDYTSRWLYDPAAAAAGASFPLRSLNIVNMIPVDLNAILYWNEVAIAFFLNLANQTAAAADWAARAQSRSDAMQAVLWNDTFGTFFDYNLTAQAQQTFAARDTDALPFETDPAPSPDQQLVFNVGQLLPFLTGAVPAVIRNNPAAVRRAFIRIELYLNARPGGIAPTNFRTGQQWDQPNVWPPHMQMLIEALLNTPPTNGPQDPDYVWTQHLALRLAQRYLDSAFCTWRATGGASESLPKLPSLNASTDLGGLMFEKYSDASLNEAGGGGEYQVVVGFGWSNGVLIWIADTFRDRLQTPPCTTNITGATPGPVVPPTGMLDGDEQRRRAVKLDAFDAKWIARGAGGTA